MRTDVKFTYDDYRTLPETGPRYELIDGDLLMTPAPTSDHQRISQRLNFAIYGHVTPRRLGEVFCAPFDVKFTDLDVVQPDIVYISSARSAIIRKEGAFGAPELVVEILSPATASRDRTAKRKLYARHGVAELWLVDPDAKSLEVWRFAQRIDAPVLQLGAGDRLETPLLPGLTIALAEVFA